MKSSNQLIKISPKKSQDTAKIVIATIAFLMTQLIQIVIEFYEICMILLLE
jgi:hypothetical protein